MTKEEKKLIAREKHPGRVVQGHKLAALMKKRKEEILRNKEQSTVQSREQSSVQSTYSLQNSHQYSLQYSLQYSQMMLMSMALVSLLSLPLAFVYFLHIMLLRLKIKNSSMKNRINNQNDLICFRPYIINQ